jgi:hypothetical protein
LRLFFAASYFFAAHDYSVNANQKKRDTLRCEKIASMLFFVAYFGRFLGIIQVAHLDMCNILKCSERFIVFNGANSFSIKRF